MLDADADFDRDRLPDFPALDVGCVVGGLETAAEPEVAGGSVVELVGGGGFGEAFDVRGVITFDVGLDGWAAGCEGGGADGAGIGFGDYAVGEGAACQSGCRDEGAEMHVGV